MKNQTKITPYGEGGYRSATIAHRRGIEELGDGCGMLGPRKGGLPLFKKLLMSFDSLLAAVRLRPALIRWTGRPRLRLLEACDPQLPSAFEGYRILHLTDLHLELAPQLAEMALAALPERRFDLVVITGDFRDFAAYERLESPLKRLLDGIEAADGVLATLGNHDSLEALPLLRRLGITLLLNESVVLRRGDQQLTITAIEDSHFFYDPHTLKAMTIAPEGYKLMLAHTPDFFRWAAIAGYRLYLCGHTHGGQICLPGGYPLLLHTVAPPAQVTDPWQHRQLLGFTGRGLGYSRLAIRAFCPPELATVTLRNAPSRGDSAGAGCPQWREHPSEP